MEFVPQKIGKISLHCGHFSISSLKTKLKVGTIFITGSKTENGWQPRWNFSRLTR